MIEIQNIDKYYNKNKSNQNHVIKNLSLNLGDKGLTAILGASGSGKSTLLNVIAGLDSIDNGSITIDNKKHSKYNVQNWNELRCNDIGFIFQNYNLINTLTVYDNLKFVLEQIGIYDKKIQKEKILYALNLVGMVNFKNRMPLALSGGQKQRVGIARALVKGPRIIIADEPTGNLDSDNTFSIMDILKSISKTCLVVLVTHEKNIANFFADRIVNVKDGVVESDCKNDSDKSLKLTNNKNIYLKDLKVKNSVSNKKLTLNYIGNSENNFTINLIEMDGKLFIDERNLPGPITIINNKSEFQTIDDSFKNLDKKLHKTKKIDNDILFKNKVKSKPKFFENLIDKWKMSRNNVASMKKSQKWFFYICNFVLALILCTFLFSEISYYNQNKFEYRAMPGLMTFKEFDISNNSQKKPEEVGIDYVVYPANYINIDNESLFLQTTYGDFSGIYLKRDFSDVKLVKGRLPRYNECIISYKFANQIQEKLKYKAIDDIDFLLGLKLNKYKIVGFCEEDFDCCYINNETYSDIFELDQMRINIIPKDKNKAQNNGYQNLKEMQLREYLKNKKDLEKSVVIGTIIVMAFSIFCSFLIFKSQIIKNLKQIGINRCLGVSKYKIIKDKLRDYLYIHNRSSLFGILGSILLMKLVAIYSCSNFKFNILPVLISIGCIYLINIIVMFFNMTILLNKKPSQIMSKYDI